MTKEEEQHYKELNQHITEELKNINKAYDDVHLDYEKRKNEILSKLRTLKVLFEEDWKVHAPAAWLDQAIDFIKESKYIHE